MMQLAGYSPLGMNPLAASFVPIASFKNTSQPQPFSSLELLPTTLLIAVCEYLTFDDLRRLSSTSRTCRNVVLSFSIPDLIKANGQLSSSDRHVTDKFTAIQLYCYGETVARNIRNACFTTSQVRKWQNRAIPVAKANSYALIYTTGLDLNIKIRDSAWRTIKCGQNYTEDIVDLAFTNKAYEIVIGTADGLVSRLDTRKGDAVQLLKAQRQGRERNSINFDPVQAIAYHTRGDATVVAYKSGNISIKSLRTQLPGRPWKCDMIPSSDSFAVGCRSRTPLSLYAIRGESIDEVRRFSNNNNRMTSVLAVQALSPHLLIGAWYDGSTRIHDLRSSASHVSKLQDPYEDSASYSLASHDYTIFTGAARNGTLRIYDLRNNKGLSVFMGPRERGPLYSIVAEPSRVFGAFDTSLVCLDFWKTSANTASSRYDANYKMASYLDHAKPSTLRTAS